MLLHCTALMLPCSNLLLKISWTNSWNSGFNGEITPIPGLPDKTLKVLFWIPRSLPKTFMFAGQHYHRVKAKFARKQDGGQGIPTPTSDLCEAKKNFWIFSTGVVSTSLGVYDGRECVDRWTPFDIHLALSSLFANFWFGSQWLKQSFTFCFFSIWT